MRCVANAVHHFLTLFLLTGLAIEKLYQPKQIPLRASFGMTIILGSKFAPTKTKYN